MSLSIQIVTSLEVPEIFARAIKPEPGVVLSANQTQDIIGFLEEYDTYALNQKVVTLELAPYRAIFAFDATTKRGGKTLEVRAAFLTEDYNLNWALKSQKQTFGPADILQALEEITHDQLASDTDDE